MNKLYILIALFIAFLGNSQTSSKKVLFLGNSLTYSNDMPKILEHIAKNFKLTIKTKALCYPNYGLEDHWKDQKFQNLIHQQRFDNVIIQQGPSSQEPGKKMLVHYGTKIKAVCKRKNITLGYFMVWPAKRYYHTFDGVITNHQYAAKISAAQLYPVGAIWKMYEAKDNLESLYSYDQFHPSTAGSLLAALTIFKGLYPNKDITTLNFKKYKKWINDQKSFEKMIELIQTYKSPSNKISN
ncbi:hypothetical protein [Aquimarina sp. AU474]|uniref:hypothetical protein n=1 Tax=Aquimarina sp. AU474 TaxID=2108529 RepID=UPI000D687687|nr:hypothetical protein [Aquimarina sp. AU474]